MTATRTPALWLLLPLALAIAFPFLTDNVYFLGVVISAFITAIAVYGMNVFVGYTGQLSLAHAGFFGIGAYGAGILMKQGWSFWLALPVAVLVTIVVGWLVGLVALRTRGDYFAIFTLAVGVIITIIIDRWEGLTGGTDGLIGIPRPGPIGPIEFTDLTTMYYLVLAALLFTIFFVWSLVHSLVGRTFVAIRNSEELARTLGIDVGRNQQLSFVISVALAGFAGGLFAAFQGYIGPSSSSIILTFNMLLFLLLGGIASMSGPLVGTLLVVIATQALQQFEEYQLVIFGPLLVIVVIFFPYGLASLWASIGRRLSGVAGPKPPRAEPARVATVKPRT